MEVTRDLPDVRPPPGGFVPRRRPLILLMLLCITAAARPVAAQEKAPATAPATPTGAATPKADAVDATIRQTLPDLLDTKKGPPAIEKLAALRDARVLLAFKRI